MLVREVYSITTQWAKEKKKTHGVSLVSTPWFVDTSKLAAHSPDTPQAKKSRIKATSKKCELLPSYFSRSSERETGIAYAANFTFPRTRDALSNLTSDDTRRNRNESNLARCLYFTGSSTRYVISNLRESGTYARRHTWFRERSIAHISSPSVISHHASFTRTCVTCHNVNTHTHVHKPIRFQLHHSRYPIRRRTPASIKNSIITIKKRVLRGDAPGRLTLSRVFVPWRNAAWRCHDNCRKLPRTRDATRADPPRLPLCKQQLQPLRPPSLLSLFANRLTRDTGVDCSRPFVRLLNPYRYTIVIFTLSIF